jgi:hypothetical protein
MEKPGQDDANDAIHARLDRNCIPGSFKDDKMPVVCAGTLVHHGPFSLAQTRIPLRVAAP